MKAFWFLNETKLMHTMPSIVGYSLKVNRVITIPPEPFKIPSAISTDFVDVPVPSSYTGVGNLKTFFSLKYCLLKFRKLQDQSSVTCFALKVEKERWEKEKLPTLQSQST